MHAKRVIYGLNQGKPVGTLDLDEACLTRAKQDDFDLRTASFRAAPEQFRPPRVVRIGLIQNKIVLPTDAPYAQQAKVGARRWLAALRPTPSHKSWASVPYTHSKALRYWSHDCCSHCCCPTARSSPLAGANVSCICHHTCTSRGGPALNLL